jgi:hypothetical protein
MMSTCESEPLLTEAPRTNLRRIVQPARIAPSDYGRTDQLLGHGYAKQHAAPA